MVNRDIGVALSAVRKNYHVHLKFTGPGGSYYLTFCKQAVNVGIENGLLISIKRLAFIMIDFGEVINEKIPG